jgi:hypothetical protein
VKQPTTTIPTETSYNYNPAATGYYNYTSSTATPTNTAGTPTNSNGNQPKLNVMGNPIEPTNPENGLMGGRSDKSRRPRGRSDKSRRPRRTIR